MEEDRFHERIMEQTVDVPEPQIMEDINEEDEITPKEPISEPGCLR